MSVKKEAISAVPSRLKSGRIHGAGHFSPPSHEATTCRAATPVAGLFAREARRRYRPSERRRQKRQIGGGVAMVARRGNVIHVSTAGNAGHETRHQ